MKKTDQGFIDFRNQLNQRDNSARAAVQQRGQSPRERDRSKRQRAKAAAHRERRADYLIDPDVKEDGARLAKELGCSESQLVEFALRHLLAAHADGEMDLAACLTPVQDDRFRSGKNPAFSNRLTYPEFSASG